MPNVFKQDPTLPQGFSISFRTRFEAHINRNGPIPERRPELGPCWLWTAYCGKNGYGQIARGKSGEGFINTHVASWILTHGPVTDGLLVCHHCDNPPCCNPQHLWAGTDADNLDDMRRKGRAYHPAGELSGQAKLTWDTVKEIRRLSKEDKFGHAKIARMFSMDRSQICRIVHNQSWKTTPTSGLVS